MTFKKSRIQWFFKGNSKSGHFNAKSREGEFKKRSIFVKLKWWPTEISKDIQEVLDKANSYFVPIKVRSPVQWKLFFAKCTQKYRKLWFVSFWYTWLYTYSLIQDTETGYSINRSSQKNRYLSGKTSCSRYGIFRKKQVFVLIFDKLRPWNEIWQPVWTL